ncbi:DUF3667 domain-containing protein [Mucilaginibacter aurantiaciroseus]|uniref:DUF3667 domain-containing protein n=1 Tax=Mucilaginibacter aurantiaciroseus TaxID=2949308 RepID=UPI0035134BF3
MRPLFLKPGHLTKGYLAGRRAQYLHRVKMYIFISLIFFVIFFQGNKHEKDKISDDKKKRGKKPVIKLKQLFIKASMPIKT